MKSQAGVVLAVFPLAIARGATFFFGLYCQVAKVEVTASLATGAQLYLLSSFIEDLIEKKMQPNELGLPRIG